MAGTYNFTIKQGVPFSRTLVWKDSSDNLIDLTGRTAILTAKVRISDTSAVLELTEADGITLGGTNGTIQIDLTEAEVNALDFKYAIYDLFIGNDHLVSGEITLDRTTHNG